MTKLICHERGCNKIHIFYSLLERKNLACALMHQKQKLFEVQLFLRIKQLTRPKEKGKSGSHGTKQQQANNYFQ